MNEGGLAESFSTVLPDNPKKGDAMSKEKSIPRAEKVTLQENVEGALDTAPEAPPVKEGVDRRSLLKAGAVAAAAAAVPKLASADASKSLRSTGVIPFRQPYQISSNGRVSSPTLEVRFATITIPDPAGDHHLVTRTYNGQMPGPTYRLHAGDSFQPSLVNSLPENTYNCPPADGNMNTYHCLNTTNLHTHGLHISPESPADNVFLKITPQGDPDPHDGHHFDYIFNIPSNHPAGTHWYHPHHHGSTDYQVKNGMAGALIIEDSASEGLPEIRAAEDIVMVIQEPNPEVQPPPASSSANARSHSRALQRVNARRYREVTMLDGTQQRVLDYSRNDSAHVEVMKAQAHADEMSVVGLLSINGAIDSTIVIGPGEVQRWRMINATVSGNRGYSKINLRKVTATGGENTGKLFQIATDGLFLDQVTEVTNGGVVLAPGNRADFLIQGGAANDVYELWTEAVGAADGGGQNGAAAQRLLTVRVSGSTMDMSLPANGTTIPRSPMLTPIQEGDVTKHISVEFSVNNGFRIDGRLFEGNRIDQCFAVGDVIEWTVRNTHKNGHPFHIHVNPFYLVQSFNPAPNAVQPPLNQWMDTITVPGSDPNNPADVGWVKFRMRVEDFTGSTVLHCHILAHEDQGMMQRVEIKAAGTTCPATPYYI